jgi:hypothetical protein
MAKAVKERALVLVKAYPQPSQKYEETVCCAGITAQGEFVRIYPVRYRRLPPAKRFERWDIVEFESTRPVDDHRPESRHVNEDSITIVQRRDLMDEGQRVRLWAPHVASSLVSLREDNLATGRSLGVIRPDPGSLVFSHRKLKNSAEDAAIRTLFEQVSLIEESSLPKLSVEYEFTYRFTCAGTPHEMKIHDWEVQAAYFRFKNRYGDAVLAHLKQAYQVDMPSRNPHFVMGTMKAHPRQFIVIGILRSTIAPDDASRQGSLI